MFDHEANRAEFEARLNATLAALARWQEAERALAQAGLDMAQDVRAIIAEVSNA
jgi:tryptophan 2,3-dioxygenase